MSIKHDLATGTNSGGVHVPHQWEYANAAARMAATGFLATDVKKLALQLDTNRLWQLTAIVPTWVAIDAVSEAFAIQRANHTGTQLLSTIADAGTAASKNTPFFVASSALDTALNLHNVVSSGTVTATSFVGSGAGLTNVPSKILQSGRLTLAGGIASANSIFAANTATQVVLCSYDTSQNALSNAGALSARIFNNGTLWVVEVTSTSNNDNSDVAYTVISMP